VAVGTVAVLITAAAYVESQAKASWQEMVALGEQLDAEWRTQPQSRQPLWGEATDDNAFVHYRRAVSLIEPLDSDRRTLGKLLAKNDAELAECTSELRPAWQRGLTALQDGAHALRFLEVTGPGAEDSVLNLLGYRSVANAAALEARVLRHEGDARRSAQLTLDTMTMASDIFHSGIVINQMIGIALLQIAMDPWSDEALQQLDKPTADMFARGLARLDKRMPARMLTKRETAFMIHYAQQAPITDDWGDWSAFAAYGYGFSTRWMMADAVLLTADCFKQLDAIPDNDWQARKALSDKLAADVLATSNTAAHCMLPNLLSAELSIRHTVGNLRLFRMALDLHRGVDSDPLADPFSRGPLLIEKTGNALRLKSVGDAGHRRLERLVAF